MEIRKYELDLETYPHMPQGAVILSVHEQDDKIFVWAMVRPEMPLVNRKIMLVGTGQPITENIILKSATEFTFIGTVHTPPFVWHIFDLGETEI